MGNFVRNVSHAHQIDVYFDNGIIAEISGTTEPCDAANVIDRREFLLLPSFINTHGHLFIENMLKDQTNEVGSRDFYMLPRTGRSEHSSTNRVRMKAPRRRKDGRSRRFPRRVGPAGALRHGCRKPSAR